MEDERFNFIYSNTQMLDSRLFAKQIIVFTLDSYNRLSLNQFSFLNPLTFFLSKAVLFYTIFSNHVPILRVFHSFSTLFVFIKTTFGI